MNRRAAILAQPTAQNKLNNEEDHQNDRDHKDDSINHVIKQTDLASLTYALQIFKPLPLPLPLPLLHSSTPHPSLSYTFMI